MLQTERAFAFHANVHRADYMVGYQRRDVRNMRVWPVTDRLSVIAVMSQPLLSHLGLTQSNRSQCHRNCAQSWHQPAATDAAGWRIRAVERTVTSQ